MNQTGCRFIDERKRRRLVEFSKHAETYAHSVNKTVVSQLAAEQIESSKSDMQELALIPKIVVGNLYTPANSTITFSSIVSEMRKHHPIYVR